MSEQAVIDTIAVVMMGFLLIAGFDLVGSRWKSSSHEGVHDAPGWHSTRGRHGSMLAMTALASVLVIAIVISLRQNSWVYGDMPRYVQDYERVQTGLPSVFNDPGWRIYQAFLAQITGSRGFIAITTFAYLGLYVVSAWRYSHDRWPYLVLMHLGMVDFLSYATNGIRPGLSSAVVVLAAAAPRFRWAMCAIAASIHAIYAVPCLMLFIASRISTSRVHFVWYACAAYSLAGTPLFVDLLASTNWVAFMDAERLIYLDSNWITNQGGAQGLKLQFLLVSAVPIFLVMSGKAHTQRLATEVNSTTAEWSDSNYEIVYRAYCLSNCAWLLLSTHPVHSRIAHLSWCLLPFAMFYSTEKCHARRAMATMLAFAAVGIVYSVPNWARLIKVDW